MIPMKFEFHPATPDRWEDVEALFGKRGACGGCWCRFWKQTRSEYEKDKGEANRKALKKSVQSGEVPGLLAYAGTEPVGWCAVEPRERFSSLARSRVLMPVDDRPVWSIPCFFVRRDYRNKGLTVLLLKAAAKYARGKGAEMLEGYPVGAAKGRMPDAFAYRGLPTSFQRAGFHVAARRSPHRPIMRLEIARKKTHRP
jgi:GNAT superfamily N-acetyltransferase